MIAPISIAMLEKALRDMIAAVKPIAERMHELGLDHIDDAPFGLHPDDLRRLWTLVTAAAGAQSVLEARAKEPRRFVVEVAHPSKPYIEEIETEHTDIETIMRDLANGQWDQPNRVFEIIDATAEIAGLVGESSMDQQEVLPAAIARWCEAHGADCFTMREPDPDDLYEQYRELRRIFP